MDDGANGAFVVVDNAIGQSSVSKDVTTGLSVGLEFRFKVIANNQVGAVTGNIVSTIVADVPDTPLSGPTIV